MLGLISPEHLALGNIPRADRVSRLEAGNLILVLFAVFTVMGAAIMLTLLALWRGGKAKREEKYIEPRKLSLAGIILLILSLALVAGLMLVPFLLKDEGGQTTSPGLVTGQEAIHLQRELKSIKRAQESFPIARTQASPWSRWFWLAGGVTILSAMVLAGMRICKWRLHGDKQPVGVKPKEGKQEMLTDLIEITLVELEKEPEPRRAIIACYEQFKALLHRKGFPMPPHYTAEEYLYDILKRFLVPPRPLWTLTALFERASFSVHEMTAQDKLAAIQALSQIKMNLASCKTDK